ncbi:acyl-CoA dehydrogenase family protein [Chelatococcus reniformis]|uniref:Acyl-CoA dehydrogenase n=1 Tax=Chelatococcus reniformis TaxID=1494448 RepID=A0A916TW81_9HYPH|nr:acyl-CoA dehydrogenase family protein [Chelatococcus reniformis]GGC45917.1 acyl-CoA dehydrogenase [Chelatococcus reniformis]
MNQITRDIRADIATPAGAPLATGRTLTDELLARFAGRAAAYDRDNRFFQEDFEDLKAAGYLLASVPESFGGAGLALPELLGEQVRLAYHAPATALAINMHLYWTGTAAHLWRRGDHSADWILQEAAAGKVFAAGHGEPGNDLGLAGSLVDAQPLGDGSYRFTGRKTFTSLSPVWDWLGIHGLDSSDPANPRIVHAFIARRAPGHRVEETWDTLGVRATRSDDTVLEGVVADAAHVTRILPAGPPVDPFVDGILGAAIPSIAAVYYGIARRAFDLAVDGAKRRTSPALRGKTYAYHGPTQTAVAQAAIELDSIWALLDRVAVEWSENADHGPYWGAKLLAAKQHAVDGARRVVDLATKIAGASSLYRRNELERLYRDVRSGPFHPPNTDASYDVIGRTYLGALDAPA